MSSILDLLSSDLTRWHVVSSRGARVRRAVVTVVGVVRRIRIKRNRLLYVVLSRTLPRVGRSEKNGWCRLYARWIVVLPSGNGWPTTEKWRCTRVIYTMHTRSTARDDSSFELWPFRRAEIPCVKIVKVTEAQSATTFTAGLAQTGTRLTVGRRPPFEARGIECRRTPFGRARWWTGRPPGKTEYRLNVRKTMDGGAASGTTAALLSVDLVCDRVARIHSAIGATALTAYTVIGQWLNRKAEQRGQQLYAQQLTY